MNLAEKDDNLTPIMKRPIQLVGVRQNNLKNITVQFPPRQLTVVTGLSGSGKSSLVFDTLYAEGQRRYVESLSTYARQFLEKMPKPDVDSVENIPPAIALEQRNPVVSSRSTVGTQTEIVDYLRLLYAKTGHTFCGNCGTEVKRLDAQSIVEWALAWLPGKKALIVAPLSLGAEATEQAASSSAGKKKAAKKKKSKLAQKKTASKKSNPPQPGSSLFQVLKEQGFQRILWHPSASSAKAKSKGTLFSLDEPDDLDLLSKFPPAELYVVVDRLRLSSDSESIETATDTDTRSRLTDSIDQAFSVGHGRIGFFDLDSQDWKTFDRRFACMKCGKEHREPEPNLFSFNNPVGACSHCSGFGYTLELDESLVVPDPSKTLKNGAVDPFAKPSLSDWETDLLRFAERHGISTGKRYRELTPAQRKLLWAGDPNDSSFPGITACFEELKRWKYKLHIRVFIRRYQSQSLCAVCKGARLKPEALWIKVGKINLSEALDQPVSAALEWVRGLDLSAQDRKIASEVLHQLERRLFYLEEVGVGYLTLSRLSKTLSGGEFQRINLATQLGNGLCGTLYILDEPSIGLHASDTERLIGVLKRLRDQGNTVVVVEHDLEVMRSADWLVELGPGAGSRGGERIAQGEPPTLSVHADSVTGKYLTGALRLTRSRSARPAPRRGIRITGCRENNLQNIDADFPLDRMVVVTGVSGSGKTTLVHKTLHAALSKIFYRTTDSVGRFDRLYGAEQISGVVLLDQSPIGKSSRSNPATYLKAWDEIRRLLASQSIAIRRGLTPQHFSFNVDGGRCPVCKGEGEITLDMHFMAEIRLPCEECGGRRFKKNILEITYRGKNVDQLLHTTIDDAFDLLRDNPVLSRKLGILRDVGLGYLHLGQPAPTLSGGESQRLKIAAALEDRASKNQLYIFDEPTTGLHLEDIRKLLSVIHDLIDSGHSAIVIEHHLDVIAQADWVIDLGPGGGKDGGVILGSGPPHQLLSHSRSLTGEMLRKQGYFAGESHLRSGL